MRIHYDPTTKKVIGTSDASTVIPGADHIDLAENDPKATEIAKGYEITVASDLKVTTTRPASFGRDDEVGLLKQQLATAQTKDEQNAIILKIMILKENVTPL